MKPDINLPVENMLKLYLDLEQVLDDVAPEKLYDKEFLSGLKEAEDDVKKGNLTKVNSFEDFIS
ncbi:hypothetical protein OAQ99_03860 [Candidatus Kapabacteria bacterium]|nr:hypothetical protein [Candidatus Kapabacteria bacterium]